MSQCGSAVKIANNHSSIDKPNASSRSCNRFGVRVNLDLTKKQKNINILLQFFSESDIASLSAHLHNDLEPVVFKRYPIVQKAKEALSALDPDGVLVSGSGSAVFAIFGDSARASQAFARLQGGDWDLFLTETVTSLSEFLPAIDLKPEGLTR